MLQVVEVIPFRPLDQAYTYGIGEGVVLPRRGDMVDVPLGRSLVRGICISDATIKETREFKYAIKNVERVYDPCYRLPEHLLQLANWMSEYYLCTKGEVLSAVSCSSILKRSSQIPVLGQSSVISAGPELRLEQKQALEKIMAAEMKPILLHGVTGCGKTEVYMKLIEQALKNGKSALYMVPEITLTREMMRKLSSRFDSILVFHSGMSPAERRKIWLQSKTEGPWLVVGPRSALFAPLKNLGLIIVDEEHDSSYKQDQDPRYHGRDLAVVLALQLEAQIVLGSATPSLESYHNARRGKYQLVEMRNRISPHPMPIVELVDLRAERNDLDRVGTVHFSRRLIQATNEVIDRNRQVIHLYNRRGYSTVQLCLDCGAKVLCPACDVALTWYKSREQMMCHHCDYRSKVLLKCLKCGSGRLQMKGTGTEKIHEMAEKIFAGKQILRIDGTQSSQAEVQENFKSFMEGRGDLLLGTQLIAKGLDSANILLSSALDAGQGLSLPDFRSAERDFQMLTQLAGRSGRGEEVGHCIFQTDQPDHYAIQKAMRHDYVGFFEEECGLRRRLGYPPFKRLARLVFSAKDEQVLAKQLGTVMGLCREAAKREALSLLGPAPAPLLRLKSKSRWHMLIKSDSPSPLTRFLQQLLPQFKQMSGVQTQLDRDPINMM